MMDCGGVSIFMVHVLLAKSETEPMKLIGPSYFATWNE